MLRVPSSDKLPDLTGRRRPAATATPAPAAPVATPAPAPPADADKIGAALLDLAAQQRDNTLAVLELARQPKQLHARVVRDDQGRMSEIIITVTERK